MLKCNLAKAERTHRTIIGAILIIAGLIGFGQTFLIIAGIVLLVEGLIGWCGLPVLLSKFYQDPNPDKQ